MKVLSLVLVLWLLGLSGLLGQTFANRIDTSPIGDSDIATSVECLEDSIYILCGQVGEFGAQATLYSVYGEGGLSELFSIGDSTLNAYSGSFASMCTYDGQLFFCVTEQTASYTKASVICYNPSLGVVSNFLIENEYDVTAARQIVVNESGIFIAGSISIPLNEEESETRGYVVRTDIDGAMLWEYTYATEVSNEHPTNFFHIDVSSANNLVVAGGLTWAADFNYNTEGVVCAMDLNGEEQWVHIIDGGEDYNTVSVDVLLSDMAESILVLGQEETCGDWCGISTIWEYDLDGVLLDTYEYDTEAYGNLFRNAICSFDGNLVIVGLHNVEWVPTASISIVNENFELIHSNEIAPNDGAESSFLDVALLPDGRIVAVGYAFVNLELGLGQDAFVVVADQWGCVEPGCQTGLEDFFVEKNRPLITLRPNPAINHVQVELSGHSGGEVSVFDLHHRLVHSQTLEPYQTLVSLDTSRWPSGLYVIKAQNALGTVQSKLEVAH